jgi:hypothetical protein
MKSAFTWLAWVAYFACGLVGLVAIVHGIQHLMGLHWVPAAAVAVFLAYIPIISAAIEIYAVVTVWGWGWLAAVSFFLAPYLFMLVAALKSGDAP